MTTSSSPSRQHPAWRPDMFDRQAATFAKGPTAYFWDFGRQLVAYAAPQPGERALDVAAGTGAVAVPLAEAGARVLALDISLPMLAELPPVSGAPLSGRIQPLCGSAQAIPCLDGSVDVLTSGFGIAFFPDLDAALRELRRVLRPGGRLAVSWWMYEAQTPWVESFRMAAERSEDARRSWEHSQSLADPEKVTELVRRAGFADARAERLTVQWSPASLDAFWERWVRTWTDQPLSPEEATSLRARLDRAAAPWTTAGGTLTYPLEAFVVLSGTA